jgi:tetratricopeptide (TPR) repeat protein
MRRRRPFARRPLAQPPGLGAHRPAALQMLRRANRLMDAGQYEQAYPLLRRLADGAVRHGMPVRAANLYVRAAHARLEMGSAPDALDLAQRAIQLLVAAGQAERLRALGPRLVKALETRGHHDQAVALRAELMALLSSAPAAAAVQPRAALPTHCPSCSAPVRSDEVTWIDAQSAECVYCGCTIRAE